MSTEEPEQYEELIRVTGPDTTSPANLPTPDAGLVGFVGIVTHAGQLDGKFICVKHADNTYHWDSFAGGNPPVTSLTAEWVDATFPSVKDTLQIGALDVGQAMRFHCGALSPKAPYVDTWLSYSAFDNSTAFLDTPLNIGPNLAPGGGEVVSGKGAIGISMEPYFEAAHPQMEFHLLAWKKNAGTQRRPLSFENHLDDDTLLLGLAADTGKLLAGDDFNGATMCEWGAAGIFLSSPDGLKQVSCDNTTAKMIAKTGSVVTEEIDVSPGQVVINSNTIAQMNGGGSTPAIQLRPTTTDYFSPSGISHAQIHDQGIFLTMPHFGVFGAFPGVAQVPAASITSLADLIAYFTTAGFFT